MKAGKMNKLDQAVIDAAESLYDDIIQAKRLADHGDKKTAIMAVNQGIGRVAAAVAARRKEQS